MITAGCIFSSFEPAKSIKDILPTSFIGWRGTAGLLSLSLLRDYADHTFEEKEFGDDIFENNL
jgi:hypothetical protein